MTTLQEEDDFGAAEVRRRQDVARKLRLQVVLVLVIMIKNIILSSPLYPAQVPSGNSQLARETSNPLRENNMMSDFKEDGQKLPQLLNCRKISISVNKKGIWVGRAPPLYQPNLRGNF